MRAVLTCLARTCLALTCLALILCTTPALAAEVPPASPGPNSGPSPTLRVHGSGLLQLSPMYIEIRDTLAVVDAREKQLLVDLAAATEDSVAEAIVRQLESLPKAKVLSILRIQARYARQENRPDLERQIRLRMLEIEGAGNI